MEQPPSGRKPTPLQIASETVKNYIDEDLAAAHARFATITDRSPFDLQARTLQYLTDVFDIQAHHNRSLIVSYQIARDWYEPYLGKLAKVVTANAKKMTSSWVATPGASILNRDDLMRALHTRLIARRSYWKAEGLKQAREIEARWKRDTGPEEPSVTSDGTNEAAPEQPVDIDEIKLRRGALLAEYKAATGNPSNRQLYQAKNSGIHKPQFYDWLKGKLPVVSATAKNFERFLSEKKQPIPKKPKD
jgi:hypothetical protein